MARKNLDDHMYGQKSFGFSQPKPSDDWDAFEAKYPGNVIKVGSTPSSSAVEFKGAKNGEFHHGHGERCYHKHPALKLPGTDRVIYGGSCSSPIVKDADVYIGFDHGMKLTDRRFPWTPGFEFIYEIKDMSVPIDKVSFKALVTWTRAMVDDGKKVHCGCIGGHGRTGTFLAALCSAYGETDAINYVRKHYCPKAVESGSQVTFLHDNFGIKKVDGFKMGKEATYGPLGSPKTKTSQGVERFTPMPGNGDIWAQPS